MLKKWFISFYCIITIVIIMKKPEKNLQRISKIKSFINKYN